MKTPEQLEKLSNNPFYKLTQEESRALEEHREKSRVSSVTVDKKKKRQSRSTESATVKEIGKLNKQHGDPKSE